MKAADLQHELTKLLRLLSTAARQGGAVQVEPMPPERWEAHQVSLRVAIDALSTPADLLSDEQVIDAAHARGLVEELAEGLTDDALLGILARRGKWVLETTPPPSDPPPIRRGFFHTDSEGDLCWHDSAQDARNAAEDEIDSERDACRRDGLWYDGVERICWGEVRERATGRHLGDERWEYDLKTVQPTQTETT